MSDIQEASAQIIDGKLISSELKEEIAKEVEERVASGRSHPGLATVLVGDNPASKVYVRAKHRACEQVGIQSFAYDLPETATQAEVEKLVTDLSSDPSVHGILVQLPLPTGMDEEKILNLVRIEKDVDGFHPLNIGRLAQKGREPWYIPCTPSGVMYMLEKVGTKLEGAEAVVLGRSNIVGMPVALLLVKANATVTICHSRTHDLPAVTRRADVLIAAVGRPEMVKADWVKPGAVVIDVGTNRVEDATRKKGYRLTGDVDFEEVKHVARALSPSPGGVGPMTIAMLMKNTLRAAKLLDG